jgi:hypothetical protein
MQNIQAINLVAEQTRKENERKRKAVASRINEQNRRRHKAVELAKEQARVEAQKELREEVKRRFMLNPWATEADFNEAWKRDKLMLIRDYEQSLRAATRM